MGLRLLSFFATFVGAIWLLNGLTSGITEDILTGLAITAVAGGLLWRSLRNTEVTRKAGLKAMINLSLTPGAGVARKGTYARVKTFTGLCWDVAMDRPPERADFDAYSHGFRGWVWLDEQGLPQKVRIDYANTWKTWPVHSAVVASPSEGSDS